MRVQTLACLLVLLCLSLSLTACGGSSSPLAPAPPGPSFIYALGFDSSQNGELVTLPIDMTTGALGSPVSIPAPRPGGTSIAVAGSKFLYVPQMLPPTQIYEYAIDQSTGALTAVPSSPFSPPGSILTLLQSGTAAENFLYMGGTSFFTGGVAPTVSAFSIGADGSLSSNVAGSPYALAQPTSPSSGGGPSLAASSPYIYATEYSGQVGQPGGVTAFSIDTSMGTLTALPSSPFSTGPSGSPSKLLYDAVRGPFLYVALTAAPGGQPLLAGFSVDPKTGALSPVPGSPFAIGRVIDLALDPSGQFLLAGLPATQPNIAEFRIESNGSLTSLPAVSGAGPPFVFAGKYLYGLSSYNTVAAVSFDQNTGALTPVPGSPFPAGTAVWNMVAVTLPSP